jgi:uncharacterized protein YndB with AHSA1/START domain
MPQTFFRVAVDIAASPALVWSVMADVEHWPEWAASISKVVLLTPGTLRVGSRVRIHQLELTLRGSGGFRWERPVSPESADLFGNKEPESSASVLVERFSEGARMLR